VERPGLKGEGEDGPGRNWETWGKWWRGTCSCGPRARHAAMEAEKVKLLSSDQELFEVRAKVENKDKDAERDATRRGRSLGGRKSEEDHG